MSDNQDQNTNFAQHYLNVKALTPTTQDQSASPAASSYGSFPLGLTSTPVVIFFSLLIVGTTGLLITRTRDLNKLLMVLAIAVITSAIPLYALGYVKRGHNDPGTILSLEPSDTEKKNLSTRVKIVDSQPA